MSHASAARKRSSGKMSKGLVALSSAAVLSVYAAGYVQTRAAAARLDEPVRRRPAAPVAATVDPSSAAPSATMMSPAPAVVAAPAATTTAPSSERADASAKPVAIRETAADSAPKATAPAAAAVTAAAAPGVKPAAQEIAAPPAAPVATPAPLAAMAASAPAALAAAQQPLPGAPIGLAAPPAAAKYKDGTYLGWGTCRHGDIQAKVVVAEGKISSATIAQCLTRYSCSWISPLPPQVVTRQSPETDFVSGATDSTNAFYFAVVEALAQAKTK